MCVAGCTFHLPFLPCYSSCQFISASFYHSIVFIFSLIPICHFTVHLVKFELHIVDMFTGLLPLFSGHSSENLSTWNNIYSCVLYWTYIWHNNMKFPNFFIHTIIISFFWIVVSTDQLWSWFLLWSVLSDMCNGLHISHGMFALI